MRRRRHNVVHTARKRQTKKLKARMRTARLLPTARLLMAHLPVLPTCRPICPTLLSRFEVDQLHLTVVDVFQPSSSMMQMLLPLLPRRLRRKLLGLMPRVSVKLKALLPGSQLVSKPRSSSNSAALQATLLVLRSMLRWMLHVVTTRMQPTFTPSFPSTNRFRKQGGRSRIRRLWQDSLRRREPASQTKAYSTIKARNLVQTILQSFIFSSRAIHIRLSTMLCA